MAANIVKILFIVAIAIIIIAVLLNDNKNNKNNKNNNKNKNVLLTKQKESKSLSKTAIESLAFVTPWNKDGHHFAEKFCTSITYISPVWLQIRPGKPQSDEKYRFVVAGAHDIDQMWIDRVGAHHVYPRVTVDYSHFKDKQDFALFTQNANQVYLDEIATQLSELCSMSKLPGVVLEYGFVPTSRLLHNFLLPLLKLLQERGLTVLLVIAPYRENSDVLIGRSDLLSLEKYVHRFIVMTYDYSVSMGKVGPNSPIDRMVLPTLGHLLNDNPKSTTIHSLTDTLPAKILLGINFYGYKFQRNKAAEAILGKEVVSMMTETMQVHYDSAAREHYFVFPQSQTTVYYPTVRSIEERLSVAREWKLAGVAIWELGQGLQDFVQLLE